MKLANESKRAIGRILQLIRLENKLTQEQLSERLHISTSAYCKIEYGETDITLSRLNDLAEAFGASPVRLIESLVDTTVL